MESVMKNEKRIDVWTPYETGVISRRGSTCVINERVGERRGGQQPKVDAEEVNGAYPVKGVWEMGEPSNTP
ncbi:hypothetical protein ACSQ67_021652 [Phaseolus vulgaris]